MIHSGDNLEPSVYIENFSAPVTDNGQYACSILVGRNYLSYALSDADCSLICLVKHYYFKDKVIGKKDFHEILSDPLLKNLTSIKIAIDSMKSVLVPDNLFNEEDKQSYFEFLHDYSAEEDLYIQRLNGNKSSIFSIKKSTVSFLETLYENITFYDATSCLLNTYPSLLFNDEMHTFFLNVKDDVASMSVYFKKELLFHHIYQDVSNADLSYHLARFISHHNLKIEKILILLLGETSRLPDLHKELGKYYSHVKFCGRIQHLQYPENLYAQPVHAFFNLFSLVTCA